MTSLTQIHPTITDDKGHVVANNIVKVFDNTLIIDNVSFSCAPGNCLTFLGPSGSGKSTILRLIAGLERVDDGTLIIEGNDMSDPRIRSRRPQHIGMIFQSYNLFPHLTVGKNITIPLRKVKKISSTQAKERAYHFLDKVGMSDFFTQYPDRLSGGQRQRVAIARALALEPTILLCDEITSALDPELSREIHEIIGTLISEGLTVIMATHEREFAKQVATHIHLLHSGKTTFSGTVTEFFTSDIYR